MKKLLRLVSALCLLLIAVSTSYAQTRVISGNVKDSKTGTGMVGVTVQVKATTVGTYTDQDGNYSIALPANATTLVFKFLGSKTVEMPIGTSNTIDATMEPDVLGLNEVVVTALGISREKKALGTATQTVGADQLNNSGSGNALDELSGKVSGLEVISSSGDPGAGTFLQLRGPTSLNPQTSNQPLLIVDGIPIDNSTNGFDATSGNNSFQNPVGGALSANRGIDIDPSDIASITVLKGPAASALYGITAQNGAIVITTKKGGGGKQGPHIEFTTSSSMDMEDKLPDLQNTYAQGNNGVYAGPETGNKFSWGPNINTLSWNGDPTYPWDKHGAIVSKTDSTAKIPVTPYDNPGTFFQTGSTFNNNLSFSGGNQNAGYRLAIGNLHQNGIIPLTSYTKTNIELSGQANVSNKLSVSTSVTYVTSSTNEAQQGSNTSGIMLGLLRTPITFDDANGNADPAHDSTSYVLPDGTQRSYRGGIVYDNPYWSVNRNPFSNDLNRVFGSLQADYKLLPWVTLTYRIGADIYSQDNKQAYDINSQAFPNGLVYIANYYNQQYNSDFYATFQKDFSKDWNASLILGENYFTQRSTSAFEEGTGFSVPEFYDMSNASSVIASESEARLRRMAWYGEGTLSFKDQVFLTLTGRDETSSTLPANSDNFFYPSASLAWVFTDALGLSNNKIFPYGKLRLSYANVGNDAPAEALTTNYTTTVIADGFTTGIQFPINGNPGYSIATLAPLTSVLGNPALEPESTNSFEAGVDLGFFQNRISLSATYYNEKTTQEIIQVSLPYSTGFGAIVDNAGEIDNNGVELTLNVTPLKLTNSFRWDVTFNWSKNNNKVVSLAPGIQNLLVAGFQNGAIYAVAGDPYGDIYGSDYVKTASGQLLINDNTSDPGYLKPQVSQTLTTIGNIQPDWIGSITNTFSFKGISLAVQIDIHQGGQIWDGTRGALAYFGRAGETDDRGTTTSFNGVLGHLDANGNIVHYASDGVTELSGPGAATDQSTVLDEYYWQNIGSSFIGPTSSDVESASFVRIRQISLSYELPKSIVKKAHLYSAKLTVFANNPVLWTKYTGVDPETSLVGPINGQGLDYFNAPGIKSYGIRLTLGI